MTHRVEISRRRLLALAGALIASQALQRSGAQSPPFRVGLVAPLPTRGTPLRNDSEAAAGEAARKGAILAEEDMASSAGNRPLEVLIGSAPTEEATLNIARRMVSLEGANALVGGFGLEQALALRRVAEETGTPLLNIGSPSQLLRAGEASDLMFHVEASASMYLTALARAHEQALGDDWFFVHDDSEEGERLYRQAVQATGAPERADNRAVIEAPLVFDDAVAAIRAYRPEVVLLLLDWRSQLEFTSRLDASEAGPTVTGFPFPGTQLRSFYSALRGTLSAPQSGTRVALWDARLEGDAQQELNERFLGRWGVPLDPAGWAAYQAVTILARAGADVRALEPGSEFEVGKGAPLSFRPSDNQLVQPLYAVELDFEGQGLVDAARVVGEFEPAQLASPAS